MKIRITFRSEINISGRDLEDIKRKWEVLPLYSNEAQKEGIEFIEIVSSENSDTFEDIAL